MKNFFAMLIVAAMLLSVGCGNQAQEAAKDAQQKVEQKAEEVKADANAKVNEAKDAADKAADDAAAKVNEAKDAADKAAQEAVDKVDALASEIGGRTIALAGVMPGASLDDLTAMFGEPTATNGNVLTFVNGLMVTLDDATKTVKSVSTTAADFDTPEGVYVGASEYALNEYCGQADATRQITGGAEYEYNSGDKKSVVVYKTQNGLISKITCSLK